MGTMIGILVRRRNRPGEARIAALTCATLLLVSAHAFAKQRKTENMQAGSRTEITINDTRVSPENLTSSQDGTVFFGSTAKGTIYRASPDKAQAEPWIPAAEAGLTNVLGVLADEKSNTLWVCDNAPFGRGAPPAGLPALRSFNLKTGEAKGTYPSPNGGVCNDVAVAADGTAYVSDTFGGRVLRLKPGAKSLDVWLADPQLRGVDGLSILADGALYVNNFFNGKLSRIPVKEDGTAGQIVAIQTSMPLSRPDGMRDVRAEDVVTGRRPRTTHGDHDRRRQWRGARYQGRIDQRGRRYPTRRDGDRARRAAKGGRRADGGVGCSSARRHAGARGRSWTAEKAVISAGTRKNLGGR